MAHSSTACRSAAQTRGLLAALCVGAIASLAIAQAPPGDLAQIELLQNTLATVAEGVRPAVVAIVATRPLDTVNPQEVPESGPDGDRRLPDHVVPAVGSGIIIDSDGVILTNEHVVHGALPADITCILSDGESYRAQEVNSDPRRDLAVLRINARGLSAARLGDLADVRQGHFAIVMGNPFGSASESHGTPAMSFGIISALGRGLTRQLDPLMTDRYYGNLIQTDARINPGNSGGPLLNIKGEVIGINTAISTRSGTSEGVGYAIPLDRTTKEIIAQLARGEAVEYGFLGVGLRSTTDADRQAAGAPNRGGATVASVEFGTPAASANLQAGDVVVAFDGQSVSNADDLIGLVGGARVGVPVNLTLYRDKKRMNTAVVPARRKLPPPNTCRWRGAKLAHPDWEVCLAHKLPADVTGIVITEVEPNSPAAKAGLLVGQVIQQIDGVRIHGIQRMLKVAEKTGAPVTVLIRGDPPLELTLP